MIIAYDLDDTLCAPNHSAKDSETKYGKAEPIWKVIQHLRDNYNNGHTIVIYTARRMLTHKGNVSAIEQDVGEITRRWLSIHNVPYHQLVFGKMYYDVLIDDKALATSTLF